MKAIVTGASSGIGRNMAIYLGELGYDLILVSRDINRLKETASKIKTEVEIYPADLTNKENCFKLYDKYKNEEIELLVNGAGFGLFGNTWETDIDKEMEMINLNIMSLHILTKLFLSDFVKRDSGYILNVSSASAFQPGPLMATYYSTKCYVYHLTLAIYEELKQMKIWMLWKRNTVPSAWWRIILPLRRSRRMPFITLSLRRRNCLPSASLPCGSVMRTDARFILLAQIVIILR